MEVNLNKVIKEIKEKNYKRVLLQVPEGLKTEVFISGEPCYGACDLPLKEAKLLKADAIIHIGHADFGIKTKIPVIYVPVEIKAKISEGLKQELKKIKEEKIGIYSTINFMEVLDDLERILLEEGKKIVEKKILLGCSEIVETTDANIFIGSGKFHPLVLKRKTYFLDLEKNKLEDLTNKIKKEEMKKYARISKFKEAKKVGILVSTKPGQFYKDYEIIKKKLERKGKKVEILILDEITNEKLIGLDFDVYLNTACPRILDNHFDKTIINLKDLS